MKPKAEGRRPQAAGRRPQAEGHRPQATGRRPQATGHRPQAVGHGPKAVRRRQKAKGRRPKALHQNRRIVFKCLGQEPEGRPLFAFFAKADSHHHVCLDGVAISTIVVAGARGGII